MNTVLLVFLMNLANPAETGKLVHRTFPTEQACQLAAYNMRRLQPVEPTVKTEYFCVSVAELDSEK